MAKLARKVPEVDVPHLKEDDPTYFEFVSKFKDVVFLVEADSFSDLELWSKHHQDTKRVRVWEDIHLGYCPTIGTCDSRPVALSMSYNVLDGHRVLFYDPVSQVVDHEMVDKFLDLNFPGVSRCDAMNFHQCIHHIESLKAKK